MRNITFDYSLDGGSTFTGAPVTVPCLSARAYILPSIESEGGSTTTMGANATQCEIPVTRLYLDILVSPNAFNNAITGSTTGDTNFLFLQKWQCAPIRRIYNADVATKPGIEGYTQWDVSNNTNYLNIERPNPPTFKDMDKSTGKVREMTFNAIMRNAITL